ncbi:MAG TPA: hypothetical protein VHL59_09040 [Thermoanaerobaculia bacterium]|nr:hypothetical protein [Thermoanaerobaculia bacterium]
MAQPHSIVQMSVIRFLLTLAVLAGVFSVDAFAAKPAELRLEFGVRSVTVHGVAAGGDVILYSVVRHQSQFQAGHSVVWRFTLSDSGRAGRVRAELPSEPEPQRLWIAVDQATGGYVATRTLGEALVERIPPGAIGRVDDAQGGRLSIPFTVADVLLVRAGEGAWIAKVADGGPADDGAAGDGRTHVRAGKLHDYRGKGHKADKFRKDDLLIVLDPITLRIFDARFD